MTCIVGMQYDDRVEMCYDSALTSDGMQHVYVADKVIDTDTGWLIGVAGGLGFFNLLKYEIGPPSSPNEKSIMTYLKHIKKTYKDDYCEGDFQLILAHQSQLWIVDWRMLNLAIPENGYAAIGSGREIAYGSLWTSQRHSTPVDCQAWLAVRAACEHNVYCDGPILHKYTSREEN